MSGAAHQLDTPPQFGTPNLRQRTTGTIFLLALWAGASLAAQASENTEPHLNFITPTNAEAGRIAAIAAPTTDFLKAEKYEAMSAGAATSLNLINEDAFTHPSANLSYDDQMNFAIGNGFFRKLWVSSPSVTLASNGLGPLYNARSCQLCHLNDGRGHPPPEDGGGNAVSMFLRVSIPADEPDARMRQVADYIATLPDPTYGGQMQDFAVRGLAAEYRMGIDYAETKVALSGGEVAHLRHPTYTAENLGYGPLHPKAMLSPRVAPQMIGLGLLEAIRADDILARADPDDANGDGISGRANMVWSREFNQPMLGRFGLKAGEPTVTEQSASAFAGDIGISNPLHPDDWGDCTQNQDSCLNAPHGGEPEFDNLEINQEAFDLVVLYSRNLAVPARRDVNDPQVLRGKKVFYETGCIACHTPKYVTHRLQNREEHSFQLIWPYTDMLLHDMGSGLADNRPEGRATGHEWRTPPLWGIGLTQTVSGHSFFLHDGRARGLLEAILWHGGEAQGARDRVVEMPPENRADLIRFLESL